MTSEWFSPTWFLMAGTIESNKILLLTGDNMITVKLIKSQPPTVETEVY